ncbi:MAG: cyclic-di-AMP receptor [Ruminococcus sp.]|nr:cyclic-di-AMP receptor [Candidatus Copronaster equi]
MKLIIAIINSEDSHNLSQKISKAGFYSTKLSTSGGFLKTGNVTLLMGVDDDKVDNLLEIIRENCSRREEMTPIIPTYATAEMMSAIPVKITVGGATVFVLDVDQFHKM